MTRTYGLSVLCCLILILCIITVIMNVCLTNAIEDLPKNVGASVETTLSTRLVDDATDISDGVDEEPASMPSENGFPYTVSYRDGVIRVTDGNGKLVYDFEISLFMLPERERELLRKGITFEKMDQVWSLIESYTG